jgi:hypothetical protein
MFKPNLTTAFLQVTILPLPIQLKDTNPWPYVAEYKKPGHYSIFDQI